MSAQDAEAETTAYVQRSAVSGEVPPNQKYRDAHKLLIADVIGGRLTAVPRGVMATAAVMQGSRGGIDLPEGDIDQVKRHLAKYYAMMDREQPWDGD